MRRPFLLLPLLSLSFAALSPLHAAESARSLPSFIAINCKGPVSLTVEVGKAIAAQI